MPRPWSHVLVARMCEKKDLIEGRRESLDEIETKLLASYAELLPIHRVATA